MNRSCGATYGPAVVTKLVHEIGGRQPWQVPRPSGPWAHGIAVFAGVMMIIGGTFQVLEALAAIVNDKYLVVLPNYVYAFEVTVWRWIHLLIGLALLAIGIFLLRGQTWARVAGMIVAAISAIANFRWLPHSPWWSLMITGLDILLIWARLIPATAGTGGAAGSPSSPQGDASDHLLDLLRWSSGTDLSTTCESVRPALSRC
jgi:hypothetical protein